MQGYKLLEGQYKDDQLTTDKMWDTFNWLFSSRSKNDTSYKFIFLKSIIDCIDKKDFRGRIIFDVLFEEYTRLAWVLVLKYNLAQKVVVSDGRKSSLENVLKKRYESFVDFDELCWDEQKKICNEVKQQCKKYVVGALYGDTDGYLYSFSKKEEWIQINPVMERFIKNNKELIEELNYYNWAQFYERVNGLKKTDELKDKLEDGFVRKYKTLYRAILAQEFEASNVKKESKVNTLELLMIANSIDSCISKKEEEEKLYEDVSHMGIYLNDPIQLIKKLVKEKETLYKKGEHVKMVTKKARKMNAGRVLFGISRIGYTPASAICDIIDNSVSAQAENIRVFIKRKNKNYNLNKKDNVEEYLIIDDGKGMSVTELENALDLGSNEGGYTQDTLSKFGLGLKSASFAQGERLEVISGDGTELHKEYVDLQEIEDEYFSVEEELSEEDKVLVKKYFKNGDRGTLIRISKIRNNNHPSIKSTIDELREKIGVIYYYFLSKDLHIFIENEEINAFDPLFVDEATSNLDETTWDGKSVQWLLRPNEIQLDENVKGEMEITMLPHPKVRKNEGLSDASIRREYHISANNYGFYVYRNGRLINWANRLDIIPLDQDFYAFRGRINIKADADDAFNIDVSKSKINLSEDAREALDDYIADYKRKCKTAWRNAWNKYCSLTSQDSNDISNDITIEVGDSVDMTSIDEDIPGFVEEKNRREKVIVQESRKKAIEDTLSRMNDEGKEGTKEEDLTPEDIAETVKGGPSVDALKQIFKVPTISDNKLWEPYVDAEKKECVRISKNHRYAKIIYENNSTNKDMQILFELLLYIEAKAELQVRREYHDAKLEIVSEIMDEYRIAVSEKLAKLCRKEEGKLPPNVEE